MSTLRAGALPRFSDPLLEALLCGETEAARDREIEHLVVTVTQPLTERIVSRFARSEGMVNRTDAEDIVATVNMRVVRKLRAMTESEEESVRQFTDYVARLTYNAINDHLRRRYPQRTRLNNRLRYVLTHDSRLALWMCEGDMIAGLTTFRGSRDSLATVQPDRWDATRAMLDASRPADALVEIFRRIGRPLRLPVLVDYVSMLWQLADAPPLAIDPALVQSGPADIVRFETREFLRALWRELQFLPLQQRKALLLNLRDAETINVISLLVFTGTAQFDDIATTMEMSGESLAALWKDLPLDDLRIGELLQVTRQQVINLRKSARQRLARKLFRKKR